MIVRVTMDFFQHRYYRLNKTLMMLVGQWPYQSIRARVGIVAVFIFLSTSSIVPQILALVKHRDDWRIVLDCILPFLFEAVCATKFITFMWNSQKTLELLNRIRADWQVWARDREVNILHEYAERGKNTTMVYTDLSILHTAVVYSMSFIYITQPAVPKVIDVLLKNGTEPGKFPFPVEYYHLDAQKYYRYIIVHCFVCAYMAATVIVASIIIFITYVQHVCSIFAALGHKLERIGKHDTSGGTGEISYALAERDMVHIASCIDRHNDAIEYSNLIETSYTWTFFFTLGFGMIQLNILGLQILLRTNEPEATIRFIGFGLSVIMHFYTECYISQSLMDHSIGIGFYIHNSQWYRLPPRAQKLLQFMTMRCSVPCQLTAGKMYVMSMGTFGSTVRTAMSYFTFVRSVQGV